MHRAKHGMQRSRVWRQKKRKEEDGVRHVGKAYTAWSDAWICLVWPEWWRLGDVSEEGPTAQFTDRCGAVGRFDITLSKLISFSILSLLATCGAFFLQGTGNTSPMPYFVTTNIVQQKPSAGASTCCVMDERGRISRLLQNIRADQ